MYPTIDFDCFLKKENMDLEFSSGVFFKTLILYFLSF